MSANSSASAILRAIEKSPISLPIVMKQYARLASSEDNLRKVFSRLTKSGELDKIIPGVYCKPRMIRTYKIYPNTADIINAITEETSEKIVIYGADAIRVLGLSTQMTVKPIFYTSGKSRIIKLGNSDIKLVNINSKFINESDMLQLILSAAYYLGKDKFTLEDMPIVEENINLITKNDKSFELLLGKYMSVKVKWVSRVLTDYARVKGVLNAVAIL